VPYDDATIAAIPQQMQQEGNAIVASLKTGGFTAEPDEEIVALIAYLQRLGKDGTAAIKAGATKASAP
jgi:cytochrome c oxidase cbb3-type subunit I/II